MPFSTRVVGDNATPWHDCSKGCKDVIFAVAFIVNTFAVFVFGIAGISDANIHVPHWMEIKGNDYTQDEELHVMASGSGFACAGAIFFLFVWFALLYCCAYVIIIAGQILLMTFLIMFGIVALVYAPDASSTEYEYMSYFSGFICFGLAGLLLVWLCCIRERIAFTAEILKAVSIVLFKLPELIVYQLLFTAASIGFYFVWSFAYLEFNDFVEDHWEGWEVVVLNFWGVLSFFWGQLVLVNISIVTTCGATGAWYFSPETTGTRGCFMCRPSVNSALIRACTLNLGSIALGSLLVAVIRTVIYFTKYAAERAQGAGFVVQLAFCCCICCLKCLESCIKWLTEYAFVYVAIYGESFISSSVAVMKLLMDKGVDAIVQQSLIGPMIMLGGVLGAFVGGASGWFAIPAHNATGLEWLAVVPGAIVGYVVVDTGMRVVDAAAKTLFVLYAEEPQYLKQSMPGLHALIGERMPSNQEKMIDNTSYPSA